MYGIKKQILESIETKMGMLRDDSYSFKIKEIGEIIVANLAMGSKILIAGNGGSAADAQHFAAELAGKFVSNHRRGLPAIALTTNTSNITAIGNDFGYEFIFSRQLDGLALGGDLIFGISTSGNSKNIIKMMEVAKQKGLTTIGLLGNNGGKILDFCDYSLVVPSMNTQAIQESHIMIIHILCNMVDSAFKEE